MLPTVLHTPQPSTSYAPAHSRPRPYVQIIEQPSKSLRYRYESEGRRATVAGVSNTPDNKTPFAIKIVGYQGRIVVVVSCVTKEEPYRPHPHSLGGPNCRKGVFTLETEITVDNPIVTFPKLAVQCVKRNNVKEALRVREEKNIDPFLTGFGHRDDVKSIDLNVVRLCFQVLLKGDRGGYKGVLNPVVSDPIYNSKTIPHPLIHKLSHCTSTVDGGKNEIILLCTKVAKEDIKIRFYELKDGQVKWEGFGHFQPSQIYNYSAICFKPPEYHDLDITEPVKVFVELVRPSDGLTSKEAVPFEYLPLDSDSDFLKQKRKKYNHRKEIFSQLIEATSTKTVPDPLPQKANPEQAAIDPIFFYTNPPQPVADPVFLKTDPLKPYNPLDVSVVGNGGFLQDTTPWSLPQTFNQLSPSSATETPQLMGLCSFNLISSSRECVQGNQQDWNIPSNNFSSVGANGLSFESGSVIRLLNMDSQEELEPIHLSSGDLDMLDVNRLSDTLQENLSLSDLLV